MKDAYEEELRELMTKDEDSLSDTELTKMRALAAGIAAYERVMLPQFARKPLRDRLKRGDRVAVYNDGFRYVCRVLKPCGFEPGKAMANILYVGTPERRDDSDEVPWTANTVHWKQCRKLKNQETR